MAETIDDKGLDLLAALVGKNVDDAAHTTNLLLEGKDRDIKALAQTIVAIDQTLEDATVIDRKTEARLLMLRGRIEQAYFVLERLESEV